MTLIEYPELEQRTDDWYAARCGIVTASVVGRLVTATMREPANNVDSRGLTALLAAERVTGHVDPTYVNADMFRGIEDEPRAREVYSEHYAPAREMGFMVREESGWKLGYSPDGLVGDDGLIEIKCPRAKTHMRTVLDNEVPPQYMAQLQAGLLVTGRDWIDYVSFCGGMALYVNRVLPDPQWHEAIVEAVTEFEVTVEEMVGTYRTATEGLPMTERLELVVI